MNNIFKFAEIEILYIIINMAKLNKHHSVIAFFVFIVSTIIISFNSGCKDDKVDDTTANYWIYNVLIENYYWYEDIPKKTNLNFALEPTAFFKSLLSEQERGTRQGYYSYIENKSKTTKSNYDGLDSYGFDFELFWYDLNQVNLLARVLYVLPNSAASKAGLKRGDWITQVDGSYITLNDIDRLLKGNSRIFGMGVYKNNSLIINDHTITINQSQTVRDSPVFLDTVYNFNERKIAYLVYNHFTTGPGGFDDKTYDNELRASFAKFKQEQATELILDLRYNNGGYLSCAQLLSTMIVKETELNKPFCTLVYNTKLNKKETVLFDNNIIKEGANLNISKLYVITRRFSASASEAVINCLSPYITVDKIGTQTEGKNVGSLEYKNSKFDWVLHPIVSKIYNAKNESNYENGFNPDVTIDESDDKVIYQLGDTKEIMLNTVLQRMGIVTNTPVLKTKSGYNDLTPALRSSIEMRKPSEMIVGVYRD